MAKNHSRIVIGMSSNYKVFLACLRDFNTTRMWAKATAGIVLHWSRLSFPRDWTQLRTIQREVGQLYLMRILILVQRIF